MDTIQLDYFAVQVDTVPEPVDDPGAEPVREVLQATPDVFETCMYSLEPRGIPSFSVAEYRCSLWWVAARGLPAHLFERYRDAERMWSSSGTKSADNVAKHLRSSRRHHSEKPKERRKKRRERREHTESVRLWLCPELAIERAEQSSTILRGTLR
jgi:hypothetical protein